MKLLLTSAGITNQSLANALQKLVGKPFDQVNVSFIPTAANVEEDKSYLETDLVALKKLNFRSVQTLDIATVAYSEIEAAINMADVVWFSGGNTFYLLDQLRKTGLAKNLNTLLANKVYGGTSAGSIVATPTISIANVEPADTNGVNLTNLTGLEFVDFEISPHTYGFVSIDNVSQYAKLTLKPVYALDDNSAVLVDGDKVEVISEGEWKRFN